MKIVEFPQLELLAIEILPFDSVYFPCFFTDKVNKVVVLIAIPHPHPHPWCYPYPRFSNAASAMLVLIRMGNSAASPYKSLLIL